MHKVVGLAVHHHPYRLATQWGGFFEAGILRCLDRCCSTDPGCTGLPFPQQWLCFSLLMGELDGQASRDHTVYRQNTGQTKEVVPMELPLTPRFITFVLDLPDTPYTIVLGLA